MPAAGVFDGVLLAIAAALLAWLWRPARRQDADWRATITPLASIIGSGFLVVGPVLASQVGRWAVAAMAGLCALAWLFGSAIRFNIHALDDKRIAGGRAHLPAFARIDRFAEIALALAYFVSVAYYLNLLGAYLLKGVGLVDPTLARTATSAVIVGLGILGFTRGFPGIERLELLAVSLKLAVIGALLAALAWQMGTHWPPPTVRMLPADPGHPVWRVLLGCVLLVQGFETSRFLGRSYDAARRVHSMRRAQVLSTAIYVVFIGLVTPWVPVQPVHAGSETEIVDVMRGIAGVLGPLLVLAAVAAQLSAAVADMGGAGGLLAEASGHRVSRRAAYAGIAVVTLALTWSVDLFGIIAVASRAFAIYYGLQCALAAWLADGRPMRRSLYALGAGMALLVVIFGESAG